MIHIDFETYSEAGFKYNPAFRRWERLNGARIYGLPAIGAAVYAEHPSTEILSLAYGVDNLINVWTPDNELPCHLFEAIRLGKLIGAWYSAFEFLIWNKVGVKKYGFPPVDYKQLRDIAAYSRAYSLPGSLDMAGKILDITHRKDKRSKALIKKFSTPRNPTRNDIALRIFPTAENNFNEMIEYNIRDVEAEIEIASRIPSLDQKELEFWLCDQTINFRGVQIDMPMVNKMIRILEKTFKKYELQLKEITEVYNVFSVAQLKVWFNKNGIDINDLKKETLSSLKNKSLPDYILKALELRELLSSTSVKKLYAMKNRATQDDRLCNLFVYHRARTGRAAGDGVQPQNLPRGSIKCYTCECGEFYGTHCASCPHCGNLSNLKKQDWSSKAADSAFKVLNTGSAEFVEYIWGNPVTLISACLRGLFISKPGYDLICSDYSAIEAVVLAALAREKWRLDVFNTHGKIYEMSASKITGLSFDEILEYKNKNGMHHPYRNRIGKVAELASGFGGGIGAWKRFGASEFFTDDEIFNNVKAWRASSSNIVKFWHEVERAAKSAVLNPTETYVINDIKFYCFNDVLYIELLSKRCLIYHKPRLENNTLIFEGENKNQMYDLGWTKIETYGGRLVENIVQATARDILSHAIVRLEQANYSVVLHIHDEIVAEIPERKGSVEEFERIMGDLPEWAKEWPVKVGGGWRAKRYAK